jgi:tRNA pseudouridine38-40 synthase
MRNIKLTIEYDGGGFCGWQVQPNGTSVQEVVEKAIAKMTREKIRITGASRTDAGVHALAQVANFRTKTKIPCKGLLMGMNSLLPGGVVVKKAEDVGLDFHSKRDSKKKHYRYIILNGTIRPALGRGLLWHRRGSLDLKAMRRAAKVIVGTHDFTSFCASDDANKTKVRKILSIKISKKVLPILGKKAVMIDIVGNGFLKYMVRNIVGTLVDPGKSAHMKEILDARDRKKAGVTAPACGLYLVEITY